jgi:hypothetical protein
MLNNREFKTCKEVVEKEEINLQMGVDLVEQHELAVGEGGAPTPLQFSRSDHTRHLLQLRERTGHGNWPHQLLP